MSTSNFYRVLTACLMVTLTACGGGASGDVPTHAIKITIQNEAPLGVCPGGGVTINSGTDVNDDLILQDAEITGTQYICNGSSGTTGATGATGATGVTGTAGLIGLTGLTGINGTNGLSGASGLTALVVVSQELPGTNCTTGGSRVSAGFDANRDNVLNTSEISSASFVCNGFNGSEGANGNVGATGAAGANGIAGATGAAGADVATGATGVTGSAGANGLAGATGATGAAGPTGSAGNNGAAGATGNDGVAGVAGSNGATGAIGLNSLVTIVTELPGIPCLSGGVVAKSGVDSNANNSLDALEVTSTTYICNGERGAIGATGATGGAGATGATGPAGGGLSAFGYFYTLSGQLIPVGSAVVFDSQSDLLNIEFGIAKTDIKILASGNYLVDFSVTGTESNQFALKVNMVVVPGSIYGSGAGTQQNNGQVILHLGEGDVVNLVNYHSAAVVGLQSLSGGTERNVTASISLLKLN